MTLNDDTKKSRTRYPRIPDEKAVAKVILKIWRQPHFLVREKLGKTEFVFRLKYQIPEMIKELRPAIYTMLFEPRPERWEEILVSAYKQTFDNNKPVRGRINRLLRQILVEAMKMLIDEAKKQEEPFAKFIKGDQDSLKKAAKAKRRPTTRQRAKRLAGLYTNIKPKVEELRKLVKDQRDRLSEDDLCSLVEEKFKYDWISYVTQGGALENLLLLPKQKVKAESLRDLAWTPRQLAVGIIVCMEQSRLAKSPLTADQVQRYVRRGNAQLKNKLNHKTS